MGLRGPKPKPAALKLIQGNPGKRPLNLADGVNPPIEVPRPPAWLSAPAKREWKRIGGELAELGLIANIDRASLATYCAAWANLEDLETAFSEKRAEVEAAGHTEGLATALHEAIYTQKTPTNFVRESMLYRQVVEARVELDRYVKNFGLNPAARARVTPSNHAQLGLPGMDDSPATGFARFARAAS